MKAKIAVYIASPYTVGDISANVRESLFAAERCLRHGFLPYAPLLSHFWNLIIQHDWEFWMKFDLDWLARCDCLLRLPGESKGADREVMFAKEHAIPVFHSIAAIEEFYMEKSHADLH